VVLILSEDESFSGLAADFSLVFNNIVRNGQPGGHTSASTHKLNGLMTFELRSHKTLFLPDKTSVRQANSSIYFTDDKGPETLRTLARQLKPF
jgi:hypothetical protein